MPCVLGSSWRMRGFQIPALLLALAAMVPPALACKHSPEPSGFAESLVSRSETQSPPGAQTQPDAPTTSAPSTPASEPVGETRYACSALTREEAWRLFLAGHKYLDRDEDGSPCEWKDNPFRDDPKPGCHWVKGYMKKSGTQVSGHWRCR